MAGETKKIFGAKLKLVRKRLGFTQDELAAKLEMSGDAVPSSGKHWGGADSFCGLKTTECVA